MPTFPNISTLTEITPTGSEVIQVSATQKTTLAKIAKLAASILMDGVSYPFVAESYFGIVSYCGTTVFGIRVHNALNNIEFSKVTVSDPLTSSTPASELLSHLTSWNSISTPDYFQAIGDEFYVTPGKQVLVTSLPGGNAIIFNETNWGPDENLGMIFSASILSPYNITKAMINTSDFSNYTVQRVFSDNFDDDPGGTYQVVAVQLYYNANSPKTLIFAFNKAPYSA